MSVFFNEMNNPNHLSDKESLLMAQSYCATKAGSQSWAYAVSRPDEKNCLTVCEESTDYNSEGEVDGGHPGKMHCIDAAYIYTKPNSNNARKNENARLW